MRAPLKNKTERHWYKQSDYDYDAYAAAVKAARISKNLTQDRLSKACHCARSTIWRMENGAAVNPATMVAACRILEVDFMKYNIITNQDL